MNFLDCMFPSFVLFIATVEDLRSLSALYLAGKEITIGTWPSLRLVMTERRQLISL